MRITIDTSAVISVITNEKHRKTIVRVTRGAELLAPASLHWEIGNAFSAMIRRGRIELSTALSALHVYQQIPLRLLEVDLRKAVELVEKTGLYAYDAYVLACALTHRAPVLSLDRGLLDAARKLGIPILEVE
jgi:predicted nucleic acid-binding protein